MASTRQEMKVTFRYPLVRCGALLAAAMFLATVATAAFLWWPAVTEHRQLERAVAQAKSKVVDAINQAKVAESFHEVQERIEAIGEKLEATASQAELTSHINRLAAKLEVKILNESNEEGKIKQGYLPMIQELSIQGSYAAIRHFLLALNALPTWTIVRELRITRKAITADLKAVVTLVTYRPAAG